MLSLGFQAINNVTHVIYTTFADMRAIRVDLH